VRHRRVLVVVLALIASACRPTVIPPSASPLSSAVIPTATIQPAIDMGFDQYRWQPASISIEPEALLESVASTSFGWVAVGARINFPSAEATFAPGENPFDKMYSGIVWTSSDGRTWTRHPDGPEFDGARMTKVVGNGSAGALALGLGGVCLPDACSGLPPNGGTIVWSSSDGARWERLTETGLGEGATMDVTPTDGGLVAVGFVANNGSKPDASSFDNPTDAAVWRSVDGHVWTAVEDLPVADRLSQVTGHGTRLSALGWRDSLTVVWTSNDGGRTWAEGPALDGGCCSSSSAVRGDLAVVASSTHEAATTDGIVHTLNTTRASWATNAPPKMHGYRPALAQVLGASFVIFGWTAHRDSDNLLIDDVSVAYSSLDGVDWTQAALPNEWAGQAPSSIAGRGRYLAAIVGPLDSVNGPPGVLTQTMWLGTAPD
jgi:hypothetical protein